MPVCVSLEDVVAPVEDVGEKAGPDPAELPEAEHAPEPLHLKPLDVVVPRKTLSIPRPAAREDIDLVTKPHKLFREVEHVSLHPSFGREEEGGILGVLQLVCERLGCLNPFRRVSGSHNLSPAPPLLLAKELEHGL